MNKKGISTIVATVLIVLITVAAVTILWAAISPLLDIQADTGCFNVQTAVKVDSGEYSKVTAANTATVRVVRSGDSAELTGFVLNLEVAGNTDNTTYINTSGGPATFPDANGAVTVSLTSTTAMNGQTVRASVAPQMTVDGETVTCTGTEYVQLIGLP